MSKQVKEVSNVIRLHVNEPDEREISAFVQDLVVALVDVCARLGRIWPEVDVRWSELKNIGGRELEWDWESLLYHFYIDIRRFAEYFDTGVNSFPNLLEKLNQKQDSEHCPVCQHARKSNPKSGNCWYCREGFIEKKGVEHYLEEYKKKKKNRLN